MAILHAPTLKFLFSRPIVAGGGIGIGGDMTGGEEAAGGMAGGVTGGPSPRGGEGPSRSPGRRLAAAVHDAVVVVIIMVIPTSLPALTN